jgi:glycosyltransferase involved in cell wall biosynthesis
MKLLWVVNIIFPYPAEKIGMKNTVFGGWMLSILQNLKDNKNIKEIAVVTTYNGKELKKYCDNNIVYYLIPCYNIEKYNKKIGLIFKNIYDEYEPDLIHVHGSEYPHSLSAVENSGNIKTLISIQGLVSIYGNDWNYNAGISKIEFLKNITLRDLFKGDLLVLQSSKFKKRGKYEQKALKMCDYIIGRTSWDKSYAYSISNQFKYKKCCESLRNSFYNNNWSISNIDRHSIFVSQASYPIKGFHILLKAINLLKKIYPDILVYVSGADIIKSYSNSFSYKIKLSGYGKYLLRLIKKYNLADNVKFLGLLDEKQMIDRLLKSNVFVQASSIENSPNSLGEAMLLGMPCVASYVGGTADMLLDKKEGLLYPFGDYVMLAYYISLIFDNDDMAIKFGIEAQKHAKITHDRKNNCNDLINIYMEVFNDIKK